MFAILEKFARKKIIYCHKRLNLPQMIYKAVLFTQRAADAHKIKCVRQRGAAVMPPTSKMPPTPRSRQFSQTICDAGDDELG